MGLPVMPKSKKDWKHQITAIITNKKVNYFLNEVILVSISKTKSDAFTVVVLRCFR